MCGEKLTYDSVRSGSSGYRYLYFSCPSCGTGVRIDRPAPDISARVAQMRVYEDALDEANEVLGQVIARMDALVGGSKYDMVAHFLHQKGRIAKPDRYEVLRYAMSLLRAEVRKMALDDIDRIRGGDDK